MRTIVFALLLAAVFASEMLVTKEYTDYLKKHVSWEVVDYEDNVFRGWTIEEASMFLGAVMPTQDEDTYVPSVSVKENLPSAINWAHSSCDHGVGNQGNCGSCWAFATVDMLSTRCCMQGKDHGWLAPQELVSCDKTNSGCSGGWASLALKYVISKKGLVHEACYPYKGANAACPNQCTDGKNWGASHVCNCVGGFKTCNTIAKMKTCLQSGPVIRSVPIVLQLQGWRVQMRLQRQLREPARC